MNVKDTTPPEPRGSEDAEVRPRTSAEANAAAQAFDNVLEEERAQDPVEVARDALRRRINNDFQYHPPTGPEQTEKYQRVRSYARQFAFELVALVPPGRELSTALTKLEECVMHANAGIARNHG